MNNRIKHLEELIARNEKEAEKLYMEWSETSRSTCASYANFSALLGVLVILAIISNFLFKTGLAEYIGTLVVLLPMVFLVCYPIGKADNDKRNNLYKRWGDKLEEGKKYKDELKKYS